MTKPVSSLSAAIWAMKNTLQSKNTSLYRVKWKISKRLIFYPVREMSVYPIAQTVRNITRAIRKARGLSNFLVHPGRPSVSLLEFAKVKGTTNASSRKRNGWWISRPSRRLARCLARLLENLSILPRRDTILFASRQRHIPDTPISLEWLARTI